MQNIKQQALKISISLLMGISMASIPFAFANDDIDEASNPSFEQELGRMATLKADRVAMVTALTDTWLEQSGESRQTLFKILYDASDQQLLAIDIAQSYDEVRTILNGQIDSSTQGKPVSQAKLGDLTEDLVYSPIPPCRVADTRVTGGPITDGVTRPFFVHGAALTGQGGDASGCTAPRGEPRAVHVNITVVPRSPEFNNGKGNIQASPHGTPAPMTVLVKYNLGTNISNAATVRTCFNCGHDIDIRVVGNSGDVVLDVLGYYYPVDKDDADRIAIAHGYINANGTKNTGTENVTSTWDAGLSRYVITIAGESYFFDEYTTLITMGGCNDAIADTSSLGGNLLVYIFDVHGTGAGSNKQCAFQFATFKNQ